MSIANMAGVAALLSLMGTSKGVEGLAGAIKATTFKILPPREILPPRRSIVLTATALQALRDEAIHETAIAAGGIEAGVRMRTRRALNEIYYAASEARYQAVPHRVDVTA